MRRSKFGTPDILNTNIILKKILPLNNDPRWRPIDPGTTVVLLEENSYMEMLNKFPIGIVINANRNKFMKDRNLWNILVQQMKMEANKNEKLFIAIKERKKRLQTIKKKIKDILERRKIIKKTISKIEDSYNRELRKMERDYKKEVKLVETKLNKENSENEKELIVLNKEMQKLESIM